MSNSIITIKKHDKYKASGIEWIGEIPDSWNEKKIKYCCSIYTGNSINDDEKNNYVYKENAIPYIATKDIEADTNKINYDNGLYIPMDNKTFNVAPKNSILLCIEGGSAGRKIGYTEQDVCFVNKLCCFNHNGLNSSKFLYYTLQSDMFLADFNLKMTGLIGGVSQTAIKNITVATPKLEEQQHIADYLDKKCGEIDKIVETQKDIIEKLKEYKQSVITEAVTKGLDKSVPLKDSNIEYLGYIPAHWNAKRLRYIATCQNGISKSGDFFGKGSPFVSYGDVYNNSVLPEMVQNLCEVSDAEKENYSVKANDIFFTRTSETIEEIAITCICKKTIENATFAGFLIRVRPYINDLVADFSKYYFACDIHRKFFVKEMNLVTRASLSQELLKKLPVLLPPKEEQQEIANYLDKKCSEIDSAISDKEQLIEKLTEYKKSLIYECVTGKRKVVA